MTVSWDGNMPNGSMADRDALDALWEAWERGHKPCTLTVDGYHAWTHRASYIKGRGWYECTQCKGTMGSSPHSTDDKTA